MRQPLIAAALLAMSASAQAQDAGKAITNILDGEPGKITAAGITVYGTIDVGYVYQSHGPNAGVTGSYYQGAAYNIGAFSQRTYSSWQNNANGVSNIGVKGEQSLQALSGMDGLKGWSLGFDLQVNFDPLTGDLADICKTLAINNGRSVQTQTANGDGQRCGQLFSGDSLGYIKNDTLGKLAFGRQTSLLADTIGDADVNKGSNAFSLFGFSGTYGGGGGITEEGRWNNSFKYTNTIAFLRVGAQYRFEGEGQGGNSWGFRVGADLPFVKGLSVDAAYTKENSAISSGSLKATGAGSCATFFSSVGACQSSDYLAGTLSDNEAWAITAKYKIDSLTLAGGYERIEFTNPSDPILDNYNTIGGYVLATITTNKYFSARDIDVYWAGASYKIMPKLTGNVAWYHYDQHSYVTGSTYSAGTCAAKSTGNKLGVNEGSNCGGSFNEYSVDFTYALAKRLDLYAGASWTDVSGGVSSGFLSTNEYNLVTGVRFKF